MARVTEQIAPGDYEALLKGIMAHPGKYARKLLILDNIGGSTAEAMRMGYVLRETGFDALVPASAVCQGSCIYLLAAGRQRTIRGYVGLHRPISPTASRRCPSASGATHAAGLPARHGREPATGR